MSPKSSIFCSNSINLVVLAGGGYMSLSFLFRGCVFFIALLLRFEDSRNLLWNLILPMKTRPHRFFKEYQNPIVLHKKTWKINRLNSRSRKRTKERSTVHMHRFIINSYFRVPPFFAISLKKYIPLYLSKFVYL